jgi:hypothetical protein
MTITKLAPEQLSERVPAATGWISAGEDWTYASWCTLNCAAGGLLKYVPGMKIKYTQARAQAYTNDPAIGSNIELNMTDTSEFVVGQVVTVSSSAGSEQARVTVVHVNTHITVDALALNHTTTNPLVTAGFGGVKYAVITNPRSDTLLTIRSGSDYPVTGTTIITSCYYTYSDYAVGFPDYFLATPPVWTTSGTPFTNQPTNYITKFSCRGKYFKLEGVYGCAAVSGGTGVFTATFLTGEIPNMVNSNAGVCNNFNTAIGGFCIISNALPLLCNMAKYDGTALATNNQAFLFSIEGTL